MRSWLAIVFLLALGADTALYAVHGRTSEFVDTAAWFLLFALFLLETWSSRLLSPRLALAVHLLRFAATLSVLWAAIAYVLEAAWADALQAWLWIAVVILLEAELRCAPAPRRVFAGLAAVLYGALALFIPYRLSQGEWLDAADAALWLAAFFLLELNLLERLRKETSQRLCR